MRPKDRVRHCRYRRARPRGRARRTGSGPKGTDQAGKDCQRVAAGRSRSRFAPFPFVMRPLPSCPRAAGWPCLPFRELSRSGLADGGQHRLAQMRRAIGHHDAGGPSLRRSCFRASPLPPATIAPACPIRRPFGAVRPAMNPAVGFQRPFLRSSARNWAASSSAAAADFADHDDRFRFRIGQEHLQHIDMFGALDRVAADPPRRLTGPGPGPKSA